jgi:hypothetical protein
MVSIVVLSGFSERLLRKSAPAHYHASAGAGLLNAANKLRAADIQHLPNQWLCQWGPATSRPGPLFRTTPPTTSEACCPDLACVVDRLKVSLPALLGRVDLVGEAGRRPGGGRLVEL